MARICRMIEHCRQNARLSDWIKHTRRSFLESQRDRGRLVGQKTQHSSPEQTQNSHATGPPWIIIVLFIPITLSLETGASTGGSRSHSK